MVATMASIGSCLTLWACTESVDRALDIIKRCRVIVVIVSYVGNGSTALVTNGSVETETLTVSRFVVVLVSSLFGCGGDLSHGVFAWSNSWLVYNKGSWAFWSVLLDEWATFNTLIDVIVRSIKMCWVLMFGSMMLRNTVLGRKLANLTVS